MLLSPNELHNDVVELVQDHHNQDFSNIRNPVEESSWEGPIFGDLPIFEV